MRYTMADLTARAGVSSRTIRTYIRLGYVNPPTGHGPGATYGEDELVFATAAARMRAERLGWDVITERMQTWGMDEMESYVERTEPAAAAATPESALGEISESAAPPAPPPPPPLPPPTSAGLDAHPSEGPSLPGARYVMCPLLPGLTLMVAEDAAPLAKRVAREIAERYGAYSERG